MCVCVCVCVRTDVGDKVKQERHEIVFCDVVCRPNVAVNKKTVRKRAVCHCWTDARINTHKHNTTHTHTHTYTHISRVSLQSFSRHSRDSGCHDALQQMKTASDETGSEQVNTERKDRATLSHTHAHIHTHTHTHVRTTHTYTHAHTCLQGCAAEVLMARLGSTLPLTLCRDDAAVRK